MREVAPGDLIFSFMDTRILAVGIVQSYAWESPKPLEFGSAGENWEGIGWRVKVQFTELANKIRPKDHIEILRPLLPAKYSPLQLNGNGLQSVYLTEVPAPLAEVLIGLIGQEVAPLSLSATKVIPTSTDDLDTWERRIEQGVADDPSIPETDRLAIIRARKGQGLFKERVRKIESRCRITGVENPVHLVASHCKPWRDATNEERLDGENGLLLTPSIDHLFDRGFIGFEDNGRLIISPVAHHLCVPKTLSELMTCWKVANRVLVGTSGSGAKRSFGEPTITLEAKAWLKSLSCRKAKLRHQRTNLLNTEDKKSFANASEVTGNSRIKMEGFAKPGERFQRLSPKAVVLPLHHSPKSKRNQSVVEVSGHSAERDT